MTQLRDITRRFQLRDDVSVKAMSTARLVPGKIQVGQNVSTVLPTGLGPPFTDDPPFCVTLDLSSLPKSCSVNSHCDLWKRLLLHAPVVLSMPTNKTSWKQASVLIATHSPGAEQHSQPPCRCQLVTHRVSETTTSITVLNTWLSTNQSISGLPITSLDSPYS